MSTDGHIDTFGPPATHCSNCYAGTERFGTSFVAQWHNTPPQTPSLHGGFFATAPRHGDVGSAGNGWNVNTRRTQNVGNTFADPDFLGLPDVPEAVGEPLPGSDGYSPLDVSRANLVFDPPNTSYGNNAFGAFSVPHGIAGNPLDGTPYASFNPSGPNAVFDPFNIAGSGNGFGDFGTFDMVDTMDSSDMSTDFNQSFQPLTSSMYAPGNDTSIAKYAQHPAWNDNDQVDMTIPVPAPTALHACNFPACNKRFKRPSDLVRHQNSVHMNADHLCPIAGCPKARNGAGYRRSDKVTEHLWKKHGNLGYTKA